MTTATWRTVADRLAFPEAPRWRDGRLFLSEIFGGRVVAIDARGGVEVVAEVPGRPSGLGWWPDGTMLVVSMQRRQVLRAVPGGGLTEHADLSTLVSGDANDMVVDERGNAYVGSFGYDYAAGEERRASVLVLVEPSGAARVVADDVWFPNGMVVTGDGRTLLVAETPAERITAFTVADDGSLSNRRVFADLGGARPDGIALDASGALWVASPATGELLHVAQGTILERLPSPGGSALACALGGPDGHTLFVCCSPSHDPSEATERRGSVMATRVDVPAATGPPISSTTE
jgi:sugar lactone lactonase YvrE